MNQYHFFQFVEKKNFDILHWCAALLLSTRHRSQIFTVSLHAREIFTFVSVFKIVSCTHAWPNFVSDPLLRLHWCGGSLRHRWKRALGNGYSKRVHRSHKILFYIVRFDCDWMTSCVSWRSKIFCSKASGEAQPVKIVKLENIFIRERSRQGNELEN